MTLLEKLSAYDKTALAMHMPGHKRNLDLPHAAYLQRLAADCDVTELPGFDNLHDAQGVLAQGMDLAARLWGSRRAFFLINGSSGGNLAAIRAALPQGGPAVVARNCHKSVYNGLELCQAEPVFLYPQTETHTGAYAAVTAAAAAQALEACPGAGLLIITSPTFEGVVSDVAGVCREAHKRGVPVLVDEAHGSHLGFGYGFPEGAVHQGADIVVQSLHKTLPSLTQTSLLHVQGRLIDPQRLANALAVFQSTSPSYLLMSSIDGCVELLWQHREELFGRWQENLALFRQQAREWRHIHLLEEADLPAGSAGLDPSKLVLCTDRSNISGMELLAALRQRGVECEMGLTRYVVAMSGLGDTKEALLTLARAVAEIDRGLEAGQQPCPAVYPDRAEAVLPAWQAVRRATEALTPRQAQGRVCGEYLWAYPPGIPLFIPGESLGPELLRLLQGYGAGNIRLKGTGGGMPDTVLCLQEQGQ